MQKIVESTYESNKSVIIDEFRQLELVEEFWDNYDKFWDKYKPHIKKLVQKSHEPGTFIFNFSPIIRISPFKYRSKKDGADGQPIERILGGWDLWVPFAREVLRLLWFSTYYEYGEKSGTKKAHKKMWEEIKRDFEEYKKLPRKKRNREKFYKKIKSKYDRKYRCYFPGKRPPVPDWDRFWKRLQDEARKDRFWKRVHEEAEKIRQEEEAEIMYYIP